MAGRLGTGAVLQREVEAQQLHAEFAHRCQLGWVLRFPQGQTDVGPALGPFRPRVGPAPCRRVRLPSWDLSAVLGPCAVSGSSESLMQATPGLPVLRKCAENYYHSGFGFWLKLYQHILLFL